MRGLYKIYEDSVDLYFILESSYLNDLETEKFCYEIEDLNLDLDLSINLMELSVLRVEV